MLQSSMANLRLPYTPMLILLLRYQVAIKMCHRIRILQLPYHLRDHDNHFTPRINYRQMPLGLLHSLSPPRTAYHSFPRRHRISKRTAWLLHRLISIAASHLNLPISRPRQPPDLIKPHYNILNALRVPPLFFHPHQVCYDHHRRPLDH